jgi:hypothetical protein
MGACKERRNAPPIVLPLRIFFCYWVEERQIKKQKYFLNNYLAV